MDKIVFYETRSKQYLDQSQNKNVTKNECYLNSLKTIRRLPVPINN